MGNLYVVVRPLTSLSTGRDILPGEIIEMEGEIVDILLRKQAIRPAISRVIKEDERKLSNGTDN